MKPIYNKVVTVFNKYTDQQKNIYWYPHVIHNVDLIVDKSANIAKTGLDGADSANLHVKYNVFDGKKMVGQKEWLPPKEWAAQPNEELLNLITFASGDFFIEGEYEETVISDSDYGMKYSGFYDYINKQKDNVFLISNVGGPYGVIRHFEIGGK